MAKAKKAAAKKAPAKKKSTIPVRATPSVKAQKKSSAMAVLKHLRNNFGAESAVMLSEGYRGEIGDTTPSGLDVVDNWVIGPGGFPCGRVSELYSEEGFGKSSFALMALGAAQRAGGTTILVETEHGFTQERALTFGCDPEDLVIVQPDYLEQALLQMESVLDAIDPGLGPSYMVWDSMAATPTEAEVKTGDKPSFDTRAKTMSQGMRILTGKVNKNKCGFMVVNQIREKIGVSFGDPSTTPGGKALKFHASWRARLQGAKMVKDGPLNVGKDMDVVVKKSRFTEPGRKCRIRMMFDTGFDNEWSNLALAKDWGLVKPRARDPEYALARLQAAKWDPRMAAALVASDPPK